MVDVSQRENKHSKSKINHSRGNALDQTHGMNELRNRAGAVRHKRNLWLADARNQCVF